MMAYWGIYKQNVFMMEKIIEKTKDVETIYFENHLLANKIIDLKHTIVKNIKNMNSANEFNGAASAIHVSMVINESEEYNLKKANTTYAAIKDSMDMTRFNGL